MNITDALKHWYDEKKRDLPWRNTTDPYKIWLAEIILQQTRVNQGIDYYHKFITQYPNIELLAKASLDDILKNWQGLGYYTRARNLYKAAQQIYYHLNGQFPDNYKDLLDLQGVGEYTAAAIASFAYNEAVAVVDGNVQRVLSRIYGIYTPVNSNKGKIEFRDLAEEILDNNYPAKHNQAMMEFGAIHCTPQNPDCQNCPFINTCHAFNNNEIKNLPVKKRNKGKRTRYFNYLFIKNENKVYLEKRTKKDIWNGLYQFPMIETSKEVSTESIVETQQWRELFNDKEVTIMKRSHIYKHILSHQLIKARFIFVKVDNNSDFNKNNLIESSVSELENFAVPRLIERFLESEILE
jgi:A/G-specific adenine glycosylase